MGTLIWLLLLAWQAHAGDPDLALSYRGFTDDPEDAGRYFGAAMAAGDFNGDGYRDGAAIGENERISVFPGSSLGLMATSRERIDLQDDRYAEDYGFALAAPDFNGDGYDDLVVATRDATLTYRGGAGGVSEWSEAVVEPLDPSAQASTTWGTYIANAGDVDGDGFDDVLVGDWAWADVELWPDTRLSPGAAFLYSGSAAGLDGCSEVRIDSPDVTYDGREPNHLAFGSELAGDGDLNADGYSDLAIGCGYCGIPECEGCSVAFVWSGGLGTAFAAEDAVQLVSGVEPPDEDGDGFAYQADFVGDVDGDGFGDMSVASRVGQFVYFGSPSGIDPENPSRTEWALLGGGYTSRLGDLDLDGYDDVVFGTAAIWFDDSVPWGALVLFGSPEGIDLENSLETWHADGGSGFGDSLQGLGDTNGDGRPDFLVGAPFDGDVAYGAIYAFSPACSWYLDADADGYGAPGAARESCGEQAGYASRPDDCDDTDAAVHGALWYPDADGDGYGVSAGAALACSQPTNTAANARDCDDRDATRFPYAADLIADGIDQDCDGHDGIWARVDEDCSDSGDTGSAADSGDGSIETGAGDDAGQDGVDTAPIDEAGPVDGVDPAARDCGCGGSAPPGFFPVLALGSVSVLSRRRRSLR